MEFKAGQYIEIQLPDHVSELILDMLKHEWKKGGKKRLGEILVRGIQLQDTISSTEAAKLFGVTRRWATMAAREAANEGRAWPRKVGRNWAAPPGEWQKLFTEMRKRRSERKKIKNSKNS